WRGADGPTAARARARQAGARPRQDVRRVRPHEGARVLVGVSAHGLRARRLARGAEERRPGVVPRRTGARPDDRRRDAGGGHPAHGRRRQPREGDRHVHPSPEPGRGPDARPRLLPGDAAADLAQAGGRVSGGGTLSGWEILLRTLNVIGAALVVGGAVLI